MSEVNKKIAEEIDWMHVSAIIEVKDGLKDVMSALATVPRLAGNWSDLTCRIHLEFVGHWGPELL